MRHRTALSAALLAATVGLAAGCQSSQDAADADDPAVHVAANQPAVNDTCAISGYDVDPAHNVTYKGQTIGFCSPKTHDMFLDMDEDERDAVLREAVAQQ